PALLVLNDQPSSIQNRCVLDITNGLKVSLVFSTIKLKCRLSWVFVGFSSTADTDLAVLRFYINVVRKCVLILIIFLRSCGFSILREDAISKSTLPVQLQFGKIWIIKPKWNRDPLSFIWC